MSAEFKGIKESKNFIQGLVDGAVKASEQTKEIVEQMNAVVTASDDTNLYEIASGMNKSMGALTEGALQEKFSNLFGKFADGIEAFVNANPAHRDEYGNDLSELQDSISALRKVDLSFKPLTVPAGNGSYTFEDLTKISGLTCDSFESLLKYFNGIQASFNENKVHFMPALQTSTEKILEATFTDFNMVSEAVQENVEGLQISGQNLEALTNLMSSIGGMVGDSATSQAASEAKNVAASQTRMEVL